ncbi:hypothetical protein PVL30_000265 [Lodderomyces elongisporus]|uniref:uncharacterized protein n=1 Tax=Lodderomyces elongisporus TaxID=36914 RepID=UPI00291E37C9|nr:uncharacterized protein PVL30_000265 [Lodderomyces elongisporus]WLF76563.1 hypothetical protein PVL30_000265 [Lodderomyces elongisporus]
MYTSNLYSRSLHGLWNSEKSLCDQSAENASISANQLFAPPLSTYTTNSPGPDPFLLDSNVSTRSILRDSEEVLSLQRKRAHQLEKIRKLGYSNIRPIGVGNTMEELDYAHSQLSLADDTANHITAENTEEGEMSTLPLAGSRGGIRDGTGTNTSALLQASEENEIDLDAQILDADALQNSEDDDDDDDNFGDSFDRVSEPEERDLRIRSQIHADDGFMAADVEYQDDYSLPRSATNTNVLMSSGVTGIFSARTSGTHASITSPTTATSLRTVGDHQFDNENEYSEHDMLVD